MLFCTYFLVFIVLCSWLSSASGAMWPGKVDWSEQLARDTRFDAAASGILETPSQRYLRQLKLESCSSDSSLFAECAAPARTTADGDHVSAQAAHDVYDSCGIFLKLKQDKWCSLAQSDGSFRQVCCAQQVSECCGMDQTTLIGLVAGASGLALVIVAVGFYLCCSCKRNKTLSNQELEASESTIIYSPSLPDALTNRPASPRAIFVASTGPAPKEVSPLNQTKIPMVTGGDLTEL